MKTSELHKEDKLLLQLTQPKPTVSYHNSFKRYGENVNWQSLLYRAAKGGVAPLLYKNLIKGKHKINIPEEVEKKLSKHYFYSFTTNTRFQIEAGNIAALLSEKQIPIIALKGLALGDFLYQDTALRPMTDIDLLIPDSQIETALQVLLKNNYLQFVPKTSFTRNIRLNHQIPLKKGDINIELHRDILPAHHRFHVDIERFWHDTEKLPGRLHYYSRFSLDNQLIHLCLHLKHHININQFRLIWLIDIVYLLQKHAKSLDWERFYATLEKSGITTPVVSILQLVEEYFLPQAAFIRTDLRSKTDKNFKNRFIRALQNPDITKRDEPNLDYIKKLKNIKGRKQKLHYIIAQLFPSLKYIKHHYHLSKQVFAIFYYPAYWFEMMRKILKNSWLWLKMKREN